MTIAPSHGAPDTTAHFAAGPMVVGDVTSFPSHAQLARTLVEPGAVASLSTLTRDGHPYGSIVPVSTLPGSSPLLCISEIAEHTQNARRDPRASLLVTASAPDDDDPLALARVTLLGTLVAHEPTPVERDHHLGVHPHAADYVAFDDFSWWRLVVESVRFIGGFGVMGWTSATEFADAAADPVIPHATPMIEHLNDDHADSCLAIVRHLAGIDDAADATVTAVDRYGMTFAVAGRPTEVTARVAFDAPLDAPDQVRTASIELVRRARSHST